MKSPNTPVLSLPYRLDFVQDGSGDMVPGRGAAGWTVATFATAQEAAAFVQAYPQAAMACWKRFEVVGGDLMVVR